MDRVVEQFPSITYSTMHLDCKRLIERALREGHLPSEQKVKWKQNVSDCGQKLQKLVAYSHWAKPWQGSGPGQEQWGTLAFWCQPLYPLCHVKASTQYHITYSFAVPGPVLIPLSMNTTLDAWTLISKLKRVGHKMVCTLHIQMCMKIDWVISKRTDWKSNCPVNLWKCTHTRKVAVSDVICAKFTSARFWNSMFLYSVPNCGICYTVRFAMIHTNLKEIHEKRFCDPYEIYSWNLGVSCNCHDNRLSSAACWLNFILYLFKDHDDWM